MTPLAAKPSPSRTGQIVRLPEPRCGDADLPQSRFTQAGRSAPLQCYGRYVLLDRLGYGGMAEVFRALAIGTAQFRRRVVVKRILPHLSQDPRFIRMFMDEATVCGRLQHPNVIQVHDFGKESGTFFLVMEHVHGRNLDRLVARLSHQRATLPVDLVAEIGRQVCLGLAYAHDLASAEGKPLNIVHRDISPSNIMVGFSGVVKVLDFGIANMAEDLRVAESTDAGVFKGKSAYLSPEQFAGALPDRRADIFSLGVVLHEALTGRRLFRRADPAQVRALVLEMEIPRPSRFNRDVPPLLDAIVMRALERDRELRFCSAGDMAEALESFLVERHFLGHALPRYLAGVYGAKVAEPPLPSDVEIQAALEHARQRATRTGENRIVHATAPTLAVRDSSTGAAQLTASVRGSPSRLPYLLLALCGAVLLLSATLFFGRAPRASAPALAPLTSPPVAPAAPAPPVAPAPDTRPTVPTVAPAPEPARAATRPRPRATPKKHSTRSAAVAPASREQGKVRHGIPIDPFR